jgi:hypothetical protein
VESGRNAKSLLEEAKKKAMESPESPSELPDDAALDRANRELAEQLAWAEQALSKLRQKAEERAREALKNSGQKEHELARRAGNLAGRGTHGDSNLPEDMVDQLERAESVMREAARALEEGQGERGIELQREAQRLLEQTDRGQLDQEDDKNRTSDTRGNDDVDGKQMRQDADVPRPDDRKAAEEFRKRVLEGLGQGKGQRLSPAVQRYAEGLLQ